MSKIIVYYDEHCNMCCFIRERLSSLLLPGKKQRIEWRHYEEAPACHLQDKACGEAMEVHLPSGERLRAFYAVRKLLVLTYFCWLSPLFYLPGAAYIGEKAYAWVARNRYHWFGRTEG
ncbi:thiol-disulfide oxidoreductase DCC family protein [Brevibacillus laterosporus]|uniref:thiol-disulfide oxidoreductase DCC family protein n=1 Tax=Brevibacillus laterosporus TaxID=1465 RepID=UPI000366AADC|nr:DUF393 domain-containing protein [Brevibacillus laterosporus]ATO50663.1 hypothetical protein BrL25_17110 [Brevibacillus laterosporus DSM 25]AYB39134.1 DUF393 domain-containing protein [Brevibacillus laterosporus]MBG9775107.1 hypothetical protein [Brevibacillus laterosporus]MBG9789052.1 hypothetical protein [Brevibacillus laterosporus]MBG9800248.1 hypothetical protein [Brevibacillus laterosporus]